MPNKGKKSGSRPTKQSKKGKSNSAVEISRSFAKKDATIISKKIPGLDNSRLMSSLINLFLFYKKNDAIF